MFSLLLDFLSLQPIISTTDNPHRQPHRPSTTTTHITITQHHQTPPPQPSTTNHHHQHNMDTPQNQPKIKQTHTRAHHKNQSKSKRTHLGHTNREREREREKERERAFLWTYGCELTRTMLVDHGSVLVVLWLWIIDRWSWIGGLVIGEAISTRGGEGEAISSPSPSPHVDRCWWCRLVLVGRRRSVVIVGFNACGTYDEELIWLCEKKEERGKKERRNDREIRKKKEEERKGRIRKKKRQSILFYFIFWESRNGKVEYDKMILKEEYKNIIK